MGRARYLSNASVKVFQNCMDQVAQSICNGDFDAAFEILDEFRIGANTLNPRRRNFAFWLIEAQSIGGRAKTSVQRKKFFEFTKQFIRNGIALDHQDRYGLTLLISAVCHSCSEMTIFLLNCGASPNIVDIHSLSPLAYAMLYAYRWYNPKEANKVAPIIVPELLNAGANPFLEYPTFEEAKENSFLSWNLNQDKTGVIFTSLMEEITTISKRGGHTPESIMKYKLFFDTCKELNLLKD